MYESRNYFDHENERGRRDESAFDDAQIAVSYDDESDREIGALLAELERRQAAGIDAEIDWVNGIVVAVAGTVTRGLDCQATG